ncbi:aspartyl-phosphate phosphatase Spo0E family protein [Pullulanibacillus sp. KACC 23026]|uniref:aspartyl-phosphate phosphatase Spo0E family protein n=1 Tax=Pullulanibacillus sp. KACC 23026 TaxID=3028315 RepID=UPI0023AE731D|nr:aspartyl-phosphate phosphatase Spo0E family protein [Pullulanibacillus sp. KACC 23026]WEG13784.1 aspartyl-phosphate phosphatase Spo0E family protein [Pullulanibacillus sp. KACC 23026]
MSNDRQVLLNQIEELRQQMVESAERLGFGHPQVLRYSQKLDEVCTQTMKPQFQKKYQIDLNASI